MKFLPRKSTHVYVGVKDGSVRMITDDRNEYWTADTVARFITEGGFVQRFHRDDPSRPQLGDCWRDARAQPAFRP